MSLSKLASDAETATGLSRWQLAAILIGTPVVIGTAYYFWPASPGKDGNNPGKSEKKMIKTAKIKPNTRSPNNKANTAPPVELAPQIQAKNEGNQYFKEKKYAEAIESYTKAIALCPGKDVNELATFYQNRAAANEMLSKVENVIEDCTQAISLNKRYLKALQRRAKAYEKSDDLHRALADITAVCIMEQFENETSMITTDRLLKQQSKRKAREFMKNREKVMPSKQFIKHYFMSYVRDPFFMRHEVVDEERIHFLLNDLCLNNPNQDEDPKVNLIRGTIEVLKGDMTRAEELLNKVINCTETSLTDQQLSDLKVNALIKLGSLRIQDLEANTNANETFGDSYKYFETALQLDPENADIYIHRAQLYLISERTEESLKDLEKCCELEPNFASAVAQKLYVQFRIAYRSGSLSEAESVLEEFRKAATRFPKSSEIFSLYAQSLMDKGEFEEADRSFLKAIESDPKDANLYVHRAILKMQMMESAEMSVKELEQAVKIDDQCQFAWEILGTLNVQKGNLTEGIKCFDKALSAANTEVDVAHLFSLKDAAEAQIRAAEILGISLPPGTT